MTDLEAENASFMEWCRAILPFMSHSFHEDFGIATTRRLDDELFVNGSTFEFMSVPVKDTDEHMKPLTARERLQAMKAHPKSAGRSKR